MASTKGHLGRFSDELSEDARTLLLNDNGDGESHYTAIRPRGKARWPWMVSTVILAITTLVQLLQTVRRDGTACRGRHAPTELVGSRSQQIKFTGALTWNSSGVLVNEHQAGETIWVGDPSPEIDGLWDGFQDIWNVLLDGTEADLVRQKTLMYNGYWITGLDVFHQLHCLDTLRRALYPDYYPREASAQTQLLHQEHCVDYLRQAIMCHADTTPVPQKWLPQANRFGPDFATVHTCGSVDELVDWSRARNAAARGASRGREVAEDPAAVVTEEDFFGPSTTHRHPGRGQNSRNSRVP
ncbi:hypothetical protein F5Y17DRAFT_362327 [Xylariaceae sp. FL0594]|nr:hypothetical protein F5Y17DRAFT_362327 [Xylariaceae sp. FL0594]